MLKIIWRGPGVGIVAIILTATALIGAFFFGILREDDVPLNEALLSIVLAPGACFLVSGALAALIIGSNITRPRDDESRIWLPKEEVVVISNLSTVALATLPVVLIGLALIGDSPSASSTARLWGWIPLAIACLTSTFLAALARGLAEREEHGVENYFFVRWAYAFSYTLFPLLLKYPHAGLTALWIVVHIILSATMLWQWKPEKKSECVAATTATAPTAAVAENPSVSEEAPAPA